jgi:hypothetical protein
VDNSLKWLEGFKTCKTFKTFKNFEKLRIYPNLPIGPLLGEAKEAK